MVSCDGTAKKGGRREDEGRTKGVSRVNREGGNEGRVCVAFLIGFV